MAELARLFRRTKREEQKGTTEASIFRVIPVPVTVFRQH
jgi:hypothetical protein